MSIPTTAVARYQPVLSDVERKTMKCTSTGGQSVTSSCGTTAG